MTAAHTMAQYLLETHGACVFDGAADSRLMLSAWGDDGDIACWHRDVNGVETKYMLHVDGSVTVTGPGSLAALTHELDCNI